jgi:uncharacterized membrane protein
MLFWLRYFFSEGRPHRQAFEEVCFVCIVSLVPLFCLPLIEHARGLQSWDNLFWDAIDSGQLYLYSFGLLGTLLWLVLKDRSETVPFAPRKYLALFVIFPAMAILIVYTIDPTLRRHLSDPLVKASIFFYLLYCLMYYVLLVFDKLPPPDTESWLTQESQQLMAQYEREIR